MRDKQSIPQVEPYIYVVRNAAPEQQNITLRHAPLARWKRKLRKSVPVERVAVPIGDPHHGCKEDPEISIHCGQ